MGKNCNILESCARVPRDNVLKFAVHRKNDIIDERSSVLMACAGISVDDIAQFAAHSGNDIDAKHLTSSWRAPDRM